jgi:dTDP-4-dehydrorhamnose 3,5-epimerase-like enzyme
MKARMKKEIVHLLVRAASVFLLRKARRRLRTWYKWNYSGVNWDWWKEVRIKQLAFAACRDSIETLALGSSHGDYGYIPGPAAFNLCGASQDLYTSSVLLERCRDVPRLKRILLFYSAFSAGAETEMTIEKERSLFYKRCWDVSYRHHDDAFFRVKEADLARDDIQPTDVPRSYRGECLLREFHFKNVDISERVASHLRENRRNSGQTRYVTNMAELARRMNWQFVVVIPPVRSDYQAAMPAFEDVFGELLQALRLNREATLLSFWGDAAFQDADFGDSDHLTEAGAGKLTNLIKRHLERTESDILPGVQMISFPVHGDHHGSLIALEKGSDFPFEIRRVYYVYGTDERVVRGHHAHKRLEQVIVCTSGSCDFVLDDGSIRKTVHLDSPARGLHLKNSIWREFTNFSPDCVVLVLASEHYDEADYIRDYSEFKKSVNARG